MHRLNTNVGYITNSNSIKGYHTIAKLSKTYTWYNKLRNPLRTTHEAQYPVYVCTTPQGRSKLRASVHREHEADGDDNPWH